MKISPELNNEAATDSCDQLSVYNIRLKCIQVYHNQVTLCYKDVFSHSVPWDFLLHCLLFWEFPSECVQGESVSFSLSLLSISLSHPGIKRGFGWQERVCSTGFGCTCPVPAGVSASALSPRGRETERSFILRTAAAWELTGGIYVDSEAEHLLSLAALRD